MIYISAFIVTTTLVVSIYSVCFSEGSVESYYWLLALVLSVWQMLAFLHKKTMYAGAVAIEPGENKAIRLVEFIIFSILWVIIIIILLLPSQA